MNVGAAQTWFTIGAIVFMVAGGGHALLALIDTVRPTWFAPIDDSVRSAMDGTGVRLRRPFPGDEARPSMWSAWLGFNVSQSLGAFTFGLFCLLISSYDFRLVTRIDALQPFTIAVSAAYFAIALRYWFYGVMLLMGVATACFTIAAVLSA
jgi:hypothetical protein